MSKQCPRTSPETQELYRIATSMALATTLSIFSISTAGKPALAASESWKNLGRQASEYRLDRQFDDAYAEYGKALEILRHCQDLEPQAVDMQLNMVQMLILSRRLRTASDLLAEIRATLNKQSFPHDLLELRYWRRVCALEDARGRTDESIQAWKKVLELNLRYFGASSILYMDELRGVLSLYAKAKRYDEVMNLARELDKKSKDLPRASAMIYTETAVAARTFVLSEVNRFITARKLDNARQLLERFDSEMPITPVIDNWHWLANAALQAQDENTVETAYRHMMRLFETRVTHPTRADWINYEAACMGLAFRRINFAIGAQDKELVSLTRKGAFALEQAYTQAERRRLLLYIQTKSMEAFALARAGRLSEAEQAIDQVRPDPAAFNRMEHLYGIYQARCYGIAEGYGERGDLARFEDQYNKVRAVIDSMVNVPDRYLHWQGWEERRQRLRARYERMQARRNEQ